MVQDNNNNNNNNNDNNNNNNNNNNNKKIDRPVLRFEPQCKTLPLSRKNSLYPGKP